MQVELENKKLYSNAHQITLSKQKTHARQFLSKLIEVKKYILIITSRTGNIPVPYLGSKVNYVCPSVNLLIYILFEVIVVTHISKFLSMF